MFNTNKEVAVHKVTNRLTGSSLLVFNAMIVKYGSYISEHVFFKNVLLSVRL